MTISANEFSVYQFFRGNGMDDEYECYKQFVGAEEAVKAARHLCTSVGAKLGFVSRVIITDGGDCTCFEWKYGEGITFPPQERPRK